jgi:hypothetical protein
MALQELLPEDIVLERPESTQLENMTFLYNYVKAHKLKVDYRDKFPRQIDPESTAYLYDNRIYKYDIKKMSDDPATKYGCAQFIVDSERIILRPLYPTEQYSILQRDRMLDDVISYLIKSEWTRNTDKQQCLQS